MVSYRSINWEGPRMCLPTANHGPERTHGTPTFSLLNYWQLMESGGQGRQSLFLAEY
ncbi:hypothetical protein LEMLEM_LOCUS13573 [Lemmus lemmus]